jgi:hypothetical protein
MAFFLRTFCGKKHDISNELISWVQVHFTIQCGYSWWLFLYIHENQIKLINYTPTYDHICTSGHRGIDYDPPPH